MLNKVLEFGRLTADPELRTTSNGTPVCHFSIAQDYGKDDKKVTYFFDVTAWNGTAELVAKWFRKGSLIGVAGRLIQRKWTDQNGANRTSIEIECNEVQFCERPKDAGQAAPPPPAPTPQPTPPPQSYGGGQQMPAQSYFAPAEGEELPF